ncbi:2'-5' RNA ligase family protein [Streptomyces pratensis]|uniref:2'-5' RNA ligase family protein n=1 Tax=Streptomyces pratensis TaxID=1169025 RepID=UPI0036327D65
MHSIELLPDEMTNRAVGEVWCRLLNDGLPSLAAHRHPTNRPHLTLATAVDLAPEVRLSLARALAVLPIPLHLDGTLRFTGRTNVLAWAVLPEAALLRLHETVWRTLYDSAGCGRLNPIHSPERWKPHVSLARGRDAGWTGSDAELFSQESGEPAGVLAGQWVSARTYDSVVRSTDRLGP